jgi:rhamnulokinase
MEKALEILPAEKIYGYTGIQFMPLNTLYQLLADQRHDAAALARVHQHLTIADYFNYRFSGRAVIEASLASTTQLLDVRTRTWSEPLMATFGLDPAQWPEVVPSATRLGQAAQVEVVASCSHDTACAVAATPAYRRHEDWAYISCGTWSLMGVELADPLLTTAAREAGFTNEAGLDGSIRFLKNLTGLWPLQECARAWEETGPVSWDELVAEARAARSPAAPIDLDEPRFLARGDMQERLEDYCREHAWPVPGTRGELVRLILESIADSYRRCLLDLERLTGQSLGVVHLFGGGARNALLCELTADACGLPVVAGPAEATALGNLLIQARTMGDLPAGVTIREAAARSSDLRTFTP